MHLPKLCLFHNRYRRRGQGKLLADDFEELSSLSVSLEMSLAAEVIFWKLLRGDLPNSFSSEISNFPNYHS
jgi:hypothetical protein